MQIFHELSHAYHWHIGFKRDDVILAYQNAIANNLYEDVPFITGGIQDKAYATKNEMEYFAELSEAYFGTNNFYPFVREELETYDPVGFEMLKKVWFMSTEEIDRENAIAVGMAADEAEREEEEKEEKGKE